MALSSDQYKRTMDAILAAFPGESELERAVFFGIGEHLNDAAGPGKLSSRVFELVGWAEAKGWTLKLIRGLRKENAENPLLRNIELELSGAPLSEPSTPAEPSTPQEIPMDNFTQRVHPFHWEGLLEHLQKSLGCNEDRAKAFLNGLVEEDTTYVGFSKLDRDTIADSARGAVPGIKPVRINDAVQLLKLLTPGLRVSEKDGHLDIAFNTLTAQWERITSPTCTLDGSLFASVDFPEPIVGWADGKLYPHDAKFDAEGNPQTSEGVRSYLMSVRQGDLHPWISEAARGYPELSLLDLMRFLIADGRCKTPIEVYNFLISPQTTLASSPAHVELLFRKCGEARSRAQNISAPPTSQPSSGRSPTLIELRKEFASFFPQRSDGRRLAEDAGLPISLIDFDGAALTMWGEIFTKAERTGKIPALVRLALETYPNNEVFRNYQ